MYRQHDLLTTSRSTVAATRRRWSRRMLVAVATCVLGLLPGLPSLASAGPAIVQAAQPDQQHAATPAGSMASAVPPTSSGTKDYPPNLIVQSTGAPDEQLDVDAALDRGTRLFLLQARYQDAGNGQADYYLAGPKGVSHQPLASCSRRFGSGWRRPGTSARWSCSGSGPTLARPTRPVLPPLASPS
jgi:hypothetical protein